MSYNPATAIQRDMMLIPRSEPSRDLFTVGVRGFAHGLGELQEEGSGVGEETDGTGHFGLMAINTATTTTTTSTGAGVGVTSASTSVNHGLLGGLSHSLHGSPWTSMVVTQGEAFRGPGPPMPPPLSMGGGFDGTFDCVQREGDEDYYHVDMDDFDVDDDDDDDDDDDGDDDEGLGLGRSARGGHDEGNLALELQMKLEYDRRERERDDDDDEYEDGEDGEEEEGEERGDGEEGPM